MPFSSTTIKCQLDPELDSALHAYSERLGDLLLEARSILSDIESTATTLETEFTGPLTRSMDTVLAAAGTSVSDMEDATRMVAGDTPADIESALSDRFGLTVVSGRFIPVGTTDLRSLQILTRLLGGSLDTVLRYCPELQDASPDTGSLSSFIRSEPIITRYIFVATYIQSITTQVACGDPIVTQKEVTLGVDIPISRLLASSGLAREQLNLYIFWLGNPAANDATRNKSRILGFTNEEYVDIVSGTSTGNLKVYKIADPLDILRVRVAYGSDADTVVDRITHPVNLFPDVMDISASIRTSLSRSSGGAGPSGLPDFSSPSLGLLSVLDVNKTFSIGATTDAIIGAAPSGNGPATQYAQAVATAIQQQMSAIGTIIREAQGFLQGILSQITNLQSLVNMIFNDLANGLLDCLLGNTFAPSTSFPSVSVGVDISAGSPGTPGTAGSSTNNPLNSIVQLIESNIDSVVSFVGQIVNLFRTFSTMSCTSSFVTGSQLSQQSFPGTGIQCQSANAPSLPTQMNDAIGVARVVTDLLTSMFDMSISTLRGLRLSTLSLSLSLRLNLTRRDSSGSSFPGLGSSSSAGCANVQAAQLAQLLQRRAHQGFPSGVSL